MIKKNPFQTDGEVRFHHICGIRTDRDTKVVAFVNHILLKANYFLQYMNMTPVENLLERTKKTNLE